MDFEILETWTRKLSQIDSQTQTATTQFITGNENYNYNERINVSGAMDGAMDYTITKTSLVSLLIKS